MTEQAPPASRRPAVRLGSVLRAVFLVLVVGAAAYWVYQERHLVSAALGRVTFWPVVGALILATFGAWSGVPAWRELLAGLGSRLTLRQAQRIVLIGQLGKYIPGGVWTVVAQATMAKEQAVPRARSGTASLMAILLSVVSAGALGGVLLAISGREVLGKYGWTMLLALPLLALLHPAVLVRVSKVAGRITHRSVPLQRIPEGKLLLAVGWLLLGQVINGLHVYLLASAIGERTPPVPLAIGLFTFAAAAGLVVVFAPAGAGIRELILVFGLTPFMDAGSALLVVLLSRLVMTIVDFALAGTVAVIRSGRQVPRAAVPGGAGRVRGNDVRGNDIRGNHHPTEY
jgi:hypothetical protein